MTLKAAFMFIAPDADPALHRAVVWRLDRSDHSARSVITRLPSGWPWS